MLSIGSLGRKTSNSTMSPYRDRVYIIKDIILKLVDYGSLNQTSLISFCGLNLKKHRSILFELELNELISRSETISGHRTITIYKPTPKGIEFCNKIIEPYEKMFPRQRHLLKSCGAEPTDVRNDQNTPVHCEDDNVVEITKKDEPALIAVKEKL